jgi:aldose 1-epimerase
MSDVAGLVAAFGRMPDGKEGYIYALQNEYLRIRITNLGGRITSIETPDRSGQREHIVLGFENVAQYLEAGEAFGALLGRYANRISSGRFTLDGHTYELSKNEGDATLHGGAVGFDNVLWRVEEFSPAEFALGYVSPDGDQGFPGQLSARATYRLKDRELSLTLEAETTKATPVSLSAHPYFNLAGLPAGDVLDHEITIKADAFLATDAKQIPTGEIRQVGGTAFDFRLPALIGERIRQADRQLLYGKGYDHYFILREGDPAIGRLATRIRHPQSGRILEIFTTQPGLQFYTGNNLNGAVAGRDGAYRQSAGLVFEPQAFPDAPNRAHFPTAILRPGIRYRQVIKYRFSTE